MRDGKNVEQEVLSLMDSGHINCYTHSLGTDLSSHGRIKPHTVDASNSTHRYTFQKNSCICVWEVYQVLFVAAAFIITTKNIPVPIFKGMHM